MVDHTDTSVVNIEHSYYGSGYNYDSSYCAPRHKCISSRISYCLIVVCDLIGSILMWLFLLRAGGLYKNLNVAIKREVNEYSFKSSTFDTVLVSVWRFIVLLSAYGLFRFTKSWIAMFITAASCAFLIAKCVCLFDIDYKENPVILVLVLITAFVFSWLETFFLFMKVFPKERRYFESSFHGVVAGRQNDEYSRLLPPAPEDALDINRESHYGGGTVYGTAIYGLSPAKSIARSNASDSTADLFYDSLMPSSPKIDNYHSQASRCLEISLSMYKTDIFDGNLWKHETGENIETGLVHSATFPNIPTKVFRLTALLNVSSSELFRQLVYGLEDLHTWNRSVVECKVIQEIDDETDITYTVAAEALGGLISRRDFVDIRRFCKHENIYVSCGMATTSSDYPPRKNKELVRGENGPGGWFFEESHHHHGHNQSFNEGQSDRVVPRSSTSIPQTSTSISQTSTSIPSSSKSTDDDEIKAASTADESSSPRCLFTWILNSNLKGWIPQKLLSQALSQVQMNYLTSLRDFVRQTEEAKERQETSGAKEHHS